MSNTSDDNPWDKIVLPSLADKSPWPEAPKVQRYEPDFDSPPVKISYPLPDAPMKQTETAIIHYSADADWPAIEYQHHAIIDAPIWPIARKFIKEGSNLVDNEGNLYFECENCGKLFDPQTNSFKKLHDDARMMGWKVKWNLSGLGYKIYCAECGEPE